MIKRQLLLVFFSLFFVQAQAQFDTIFVKTYIRNCVDSLCHGFKTKNWELFTRYSYPAMVGSLGGQEEFQSYMGIMFGPFPDSAWKVYEPGKILQVIKTEGDLQAVIELKSVLEWEGKLITSVSHLIGESWNGGLHWTFFDSDGDRAKALLIKPDLNEQLVLPAKKETIGPLTSRPKN
ncbi:MAG TPA: hypothetical protein VN451_10555 [Chitinophagaceae bacterium]|nr:hypothetical protein [Chitinophagaceae bacterium]